jgi:hypothetical protein
MALSKLPGKYSRDWIEALDGRTKLAAMVQDRLQGLEADLGGRDALSYQKRSLCKRAVWIEARIEHMEAALAKGDEIQEGSLTQSINTLIGLYRILGIERQAREVPSLHDYIRSRDAA